jgi:hypothetical protein
MKHVLALALVVAATPVFATDTVESLMRRDVGKTFWILKPGNRGLEICAAPKRCKLFSNTALSVVDLAKRTPFPAYKVRTSDGFEGFVDLNQRDRLIDRDLTTAERDRVRACEQRGRPPINMIREEVIFCMGSPSEINKTENAAGLHEQMIYRDTYVYVENDLVTAVQSHD